MVRETTQTKALLKLNEGIVREMSPDNNERPNTPIESLLRSLSADQGELCVDAIITHLERELACTRENPGGIEILTKARSEKDQTLLDLLQTVGNVGCLVRLLIASEKKKWLSQLAERESNLRRVIDNTQGFVGVLDLQGILREVNQAALDAAGLTREDVIGKPFWECYCWSHDKQLVKNLQASVVAAVGGAVVRYEVEVRMAGDSRLAIDFMLAPVKNAKGNVTHLIPSGIGSPGASQSTQSCSGVGANGALGMGHRDGSRDMVFTSLRDVWLHRYDFRTHQCGISCDHSSG